MNDASNSLARMYLNTFRDYFRQVHKPVGGALSIVRLNRETLSDVSHFHALTGQSVNRAGLRVRDWFRIPAQAAIDFMLGHRTADVFREVAFTSARGDPNDRIRIGKMKAAASKRPVRFSLKRFAPRRPSPQER